MPPEPKSPEPKSPEPKSPEQQLHALPSAGLGLWPTPLHRLLRLSAEIDSDVWIKRDDLQGVALAGNKIRKFNLVVGQALADGCDALVTTGAAQSNSARTGATAAAMVGMDCHLVLSGSNPDEPTGNLLIDHLVGAQVHFAGDATWEELNQAVDDLVEQLNTAGHRAFAAPVGCSSPLGALGFALAFAELEAQIAEAGITPSAIVHTTTSGGTHAGLLVGRALAAAADRPLGGVPIIGVDAGRLYHNMAAHHHGLAMEAAALIGLELDLTVADIVIDDHHLGEGYGAPTAEAILAIDLLARTEGILVDPVYSAKGLAAVMTMAEQGRFDDGPVVFWHTGGYHALFDPDHARPVLHPEDAP